MIYDCEIWNSSFEISPQRKIYFIAIKVNDR